MPLFQNTKYGKSKPGMTKVLWAPLFYFESYPALPDTGVDAGDTVTATGDFVFNPGYGWIDLKNELFKGSSMEWKNAGEEAAPSWITTVKGQIVGLDAQLMEQFKNMAGQPGVLLIYDSDCATGTCWAVGCSNAPVFVMIDGKTDYVMGSGMKGSAFEFKSACLPYVYTGAVNLQASIFITVDISVIERITEDGDIRILETGEIRILE